MKRKFMKLFLPTVFLGKGGKGRKIEHQVPEKRQLVNRLDLLSFIQVIPFGTVKSEIIISRYKQGYGLFHVFYNVDENATGCSTIQMDVDTSFLDIAAILSYAQGNSINIRFDEKWFDEYGYQFFQEKNVQAQEELKQAFKLFISQQKR